MKCEEALALQNAYLDSELDPNATVQVGQHLKACPECARAFAEEESLDSWLRVALRTERRSADLWARTEAAVRGVAQTPTTRNAGWQGSQIFLRRILGLHAPKGERVGSAATRLAWAGLATAWAAILLLNTTARETSSTWMARQAPPSSAALRVALKQRLQLLAELSFSSDQPSAAPSKSVAPGSRSERQRRAFNT